ncbi:hypothetical protein L198_01770 [Cryptococcus wingfieldii CBS 7118]|uniref:Ysc84 actin-binding domain-containing protein n=1 Tax=Cryptococcus wingfieldii CBS 7118 TaxID=1295528 RepID=A0A1E3JWB1_9TREE|nr:hypothetical protein L198_01770 [Cryptococcus wingfieldii CBS 7118]ODO05083.1 hypothetical protein L198_01770 [Cryptococcus wingfieldii CBS 7118]
MSDSAPPPPKRKNYTSWTYTTTTPDPSQQTWKEKIKSKSSVWGKSALDKGVAISDNLGGKVNNFAEQRLGTEAFWPVTGDFIKEMDKCARILRAFTVDGLVTESKEEEDESGRKKKKKVIRKIPPAVIAKAKGLAIFTSMRSGIAPFGGAGGAGLVVAKLPDGSWSPPASITPNNLSTGFLIGVDVYDCVLVINTAKALQSFRTHKATIGAELAVAAGPYGAGAAVEAGLEKAPLFSYVRSRGMYAGVELVAQVFVERFEENEAMYHWPGVKAGDILSGKVKMPIEASGLMKALADSESGRAQKEKGDALDIIIPEGAFQLELNDGEVLKLPPTPDQTDGHEYESDPETEKIRRASRPGSHNPSMSDLGNIHAPVPTRPPPLPSRHPNRPSLTHQPSSTSHYSASPPPSAPPLPPRSNVNSAQPSRATSPHIPAAASPAPEDLPTYAEVEVTPEGGVNAKPYPKDEMDAQKLGLAEDAVGEGGEPMSPAEQKEWEQFMAEHEENQRATEVEKAASVTGVAKEADVLARRLDVQHLDKENESESLR